ncbi:MAG: hypothetical protein RR313_12790 [Anaerovoracaceae bacterium]
MLFENLTQEELRSASRQSIESFEIWARRIIHEKLSEAYGSNYFDYQFDNGEFLIKNDIREKAKHMQRKEPLRFSRYIDTLFLDELICFLCKPRLYVQFFKQILDYKYPQGVEEVREFLGRLIPIRNALSHSNAISVRDAEMAICYSNDFIDCTKHYYLKEGKEKVWNIPTIIKATDSSGNLLYSNSDGKTKINPQFYVGDTYTVTIEVDPSFSPSEYTIKWLKKDSIIIPEFENKKYCTITFSNSDVSESWSLICQIISNKDWHKMDDCDDWLRLTVTIYPR